MSGRGTGFLIVVGCVLLLSACGGGESVVLPTRVVLDAEDPTLTASPSPQTEATVAVAVENSPLAQSPNSAQNALLNFWEPVDGTLDEATLREEWRFVGQPGDAIRVRALAQEIVLTLLLQDENGTTLAQGDSLETTLPAGGIFRVIVQGDSAGAYQLAISYTDRPNPTTAATFIPEVVGIPTPTAPFTGRGTFIGQIDDEETIGGEINADAPDHIYTFSATIGQFVQVEMQQVSGEINPEITIYDPDGLALAYDDNSGEGGDGAIIRNLRLTAEGLYSIQAGGKDLAGAYSIRLLMYPIAAPITPTTAPTVTPSATFALIDPTPAPVQAGNRLENHVPVVGTIVEAGDLAIHPFYAAAGEVVTVGIVPEEGSSFRARAEVVDPDGVVIASGAASVTPDGQSVIITPIRAELDGVYQVFLTGENSTVGDYLIGYGSGSTWRNVLRGPIGADQAVDGDINQRGLRDVWFVALGEGDIISAAVSASQGSALDTIIELVPVDEPDTIIAIDDNGGGGRNALINRVSIAQTGVYMLRIKASQAATTGAYTLIWRYVNRAPTATPIPAVAFVLSTADSVDEGGYRFYPFQGRAGQRVQVRVIAGAESTLDPVAALIDPDNVVLLEADDSDTDLNPRFEYVLPVDGVYTLRVNGYLSGGDYELVVEEVFQ
ncbi:MAG: PPC domain-containing protein [Aggregatilineales bacterium]